MTDQSAELTRLREQVAHREHKIVAQTADLNRGEIERDKLREQVAHQTATINAMAETCAKYAKDLATARQMLDADHKVIKADAGQLAEAVGLLRRWTQYPVEEFQAHKDTLKWLAAYEAAELERIAKKVPPVEDLRLLAKDEAKGDG